MVTGERLERVVRALNNFSTAFNEHDTERFALNYAPNAVIWGVPETRGRVEIAKMLGEFFRVSEDTQGAARLLLVKGDMIVVDWVSAGTMTGEFMGLPANQRPLGGHRLLVGWLNDDGLMVRMNEYADFASWIAQMSNAEDAPTVPTVPGAFETYLAEGSSAEDALERWALRLDGVALAGPDGLASRFAEDATATFHAFGARVVHGRRQIEAFLDEFGRTIVEARFTVTNAWGISQFAVVEGEIRGRRESPGGPEISVHVAQLLVRGGDGLIREAWTYGNSVELAGFPVESTPSRVPSGSIAGEGAEPPSL